MDVDQGNFSHMLPTILKRIADSDFVAIDLELSGIPYQRRNRTQKNTGQANLQDRYAELKGAAEKYQILQFGLTCVEKDSDNGRYVVRPFNFNLSPLIPEHLGERDFTYSSGAVEFLISNGYRMQAPFEKGIPYLTRQETATAEEQARRRSDRSNIPDIVLAESDTQSKDFLERVTQEIKTWKETKKPEPGFFNVLGRTVSGIRSEERPLSRFEMRLVHQTVRSNYPDLVTYGRPDCVSVQWRDELEQMQMKNDLELRLAGEINRQVGFRWVAEALTGGNLSNAYLAMNTRQIHGEVTALSSKGFKRRLDELSEKLKTRTKVLVGHNCLLDLVYVYQVFYGDLPDQVDDFQSAVSGIFPLVFDTKYMSTAGADSRFRSAQLWQLEEALTKQGKPTIYTPNDQPQYQNAEQYHEAGFDSFVTAKVFLKLAARLETMARTGDEMLLQSSESKSTPEDRLLGSARQDENTTPVSRQKEAFPTVNAKQRKKPRSKSSKTDEIAQGLRDAPQDTQTSRSQESTDALFAPVENPASSTNTLRPSRMSSKNTKDAQLVIEGTEGLRLDEKVQRAEATDQCVLPDWDASFWNAYRNRLRVYGTVEGSCNLASSQKMEPKDAPVEEHEEAATLKQADTWLRWASRFWD